MSSTSDPLSDFRNFLYVTWKFLKLPAPTPLQYSIADWVQNGPSRRGVRAFRGAAKSWIAAAFAVYRLRQNPQMNILIVSSKGTRAEEFTTFCLQLLEAPHLHHLYPRADQRKSRVSFDVNGADPDQNPSLKAVGLEGSSVGFRADLIIADDIEDPLNSQTQLQREKMRRLVKEYEAILKPGGEILYLGTPHTEDSIYNWLESSQSEKDLGYSFKIWPILYPNAEERAEYGSRLASLIADELDPKLVGTTTEPTRFPEEEIEKRRARYGRAGFAMQFMLRTRFADQDRYPLKLSDLVVTSLGDELVPDRFVWASNPERVISDVPNVGLAGDRIYEAMIPADPQTKQPTFVPYDETLLAIDPSGRGEDELGYAVIGSKHSYVFMRDAGGFSHGFSPETLTKLLILAKKYKVSKIIYEANFGDGMFGALIHPFVNKIHPCTVEEVKHSIQKEKRIIDTLEPVISNHRLVVDRALFRRDFESTGERAGESAHNYQLFYQMTRITKERGALVRDDRLDAVSIGVAYFVGRLREDTEAAAARTQEMLLDAELEKFIANAIDPFDVSGVTGGVGKRAFNRQL